MALILDEPRTASCIALTNSSLYCINKNNLVDIIKKKPEFAVNLISRFRDKLSSINNKLISKHREEPGIASFQDSGGEILSNNTLRFKKNAIIFRESDKGKSGYIIKSGQVKLVRMNRVQKKETILAVLSVGEMFGELALLGDNTRIATALSDDDDTELISFDEKNFYHMIYNDIDFCLKIMKICCQRIKEMNDKIGGC
ncbi:MAG: cyclic nucleotide-binding domain-containing protein [Candidatus Wallbacteria bacterium]|nr:cyclic nucleotide-binding domain-containing protein [Candidatus Wallbacteria bacterium]